MTRFFVAATLAAVLGLGTAGTADAQYINQYRGITPNGGFVVGNNYSNGFAAQSNRIYYSPYGGVRQQTYYGDVFGNRAGQQRGFSPYYGSYNRGFYQPSPYTYGVGSYNYNFYRRW